VHYSAGFGAFASFAAAGQLPQDDPLWWVARLLLDLAGALFGVFLLVALLVLLSGMRLRQHDRAQAARVVARRSGRGHGRTVVHMHSRRTGGSRALAGRSRAASATP
jgi:hypothetical protein